MLKLIIEIYLAIGVLILLISYIGVLLNHKYVSFVTRFIIVAVFAWPYIIVKLVKER